MKRVLIIAFTFICGHGLTAAEGINSKVIHNYTEMGVAYGYLDDVAGGRAHGILAHTSVDMQNLLVDVNGGYFWAEDDGIRLWNVGGGIGYAIRLMQNHINIIPRIGISYTDIRNDSASANATTIDPGVTLSYAINNRVSVNGNYRYVRDIHDDTDIHTYGVGSRIAVAERIGVDIGALFAEREGFSGAFAGVSWHF